MDVLTAYAKQAVRFIVSADVVDIDGQITMLRNRRRELLRVEQESVAPELHRRMAELTMYKELGITEWLPWEPLKQVNELGQPVFAVFDVKRPARLSFRLAYRPDFPSARRYFLSTDPWLPYHFMDHLPDMLEHLKAHLPKQGWFKQRAAVRMAAAYAGVIPVEVKEKIKKALKVTFTDWHKRKIFYQVYLITTPKEWVYNQEPVGGYRDPIVAGLHEGRLYKIAQFDPTPPEQLWLDQSQGI